jgi:hypothetical protein
MPEVIAIIIMVPDINLKECRYSYKNYTSVSQTSTLIDEAVLSGVAKY